MRSGLIAQNLSSWQHVRPPGVNTHLSAHERRVYLSDLQWIEDFTLCCRLVPSDPPDSVPVRRPVRSQYPASAGQLPLHIPSPIYSCHTATSFASIWLDQGLALYLNHSIYSPLRMRAVPGTQHWDGADALTRAAHPYRYQDIEISVSYL